MKRLLGVIALTSIFSLAALAQGNRQAAVTFQAAIAAEDIERDLAKAAGLYEQAVREAGTDKELTPRILLRLAQLHVKAGRVDDARSTFTRIVNDFPGSGEPVATARVQLALLTETARRSSGVAASELSRAQAPEGPFRRVIGDRPGAPRYNLSPDGRYFLDNLNVVETATGVRRELVPPGEGRMGMPTWSLDGQSVAFLAGTPSGGELRTVSVVGSKVERLALIPQRGMIRGWTRTHVIYSVEDEFFSVPSGGGVAKSIFKLAPSKDSTFDRRYIVGNIMPDGSAIVVVNAEHLSLFDLATGEERVLSGGLGAEVPQISRDGKLVAFIARLDRNWGVYVAPLDRLPIRNPVRVATLDYPGLPPLNNAATRWLPDGVLMITYINYWRHAYRVDMTAAGQSASGPVRLTRELDIRNSGAPLVSPDSRQIAFTIDSNTYFDPSGGFGLVNADGTGERRVLGGNGRFRGVGWRSSTEVILADDSTGGRWQIVNVNTGSIRQFDPPVTSDLFPANVRYLPSLNQIVVGDRARQALTARRVDEIRERRLAEGDIFTWAASPDTRQIAYWLYKTSPAERDELRLTSIEGGESRMLLSYRGGRSTQGPLLWSPDGKQLIYFDDELRVLTLATGETRPLFGVPFATFLPAGVTFQLGGGSWAADGSFVTFDVGVEERPRLAWEGVTYDAVKLLEAGRPKIARQAVRLGGVSGR